MTLHASGPAVGFLASSGREENKEAAAAMDPYVEAEQKGEEINRRVNQGK
jgi:hypothetical protein